MEFKEFWGTFSVRDHMRKRAFVAEVLLYEKLVVPVPPDEYLEEWITNRWQPRRLKRLVDILGPEHCIEVQWDNNNRNEWESIYKSGLSNDYNTVPTQTAEKVAQDARFISSQLTYQKDQGIQQDNWAYGATGLHLLFLSEDPEKRKKYFETLPGIEVEAMVAFPSYPKFRSKVAYQVLKKRAKRDIKNHVGVFGWEFLVPEDDSASDEKILERAVKLASKPGFRDARREFHIWRRRMIAGKVEPAVAEKDLIRVVREYGKAAGLKRRNSRIRWAIAASGIAAQTAGLLIQSPIPDVAGLIMSAGSLAVGALPEHDPESEIMAGAMCHEAKRRLPNRWWQK
jgi:hypothetical protein